MKDARGVQRVRLRLMTLFLSLYLVRILVAANQRHMLRLEKFSRQVDYGFPSSLRLGVTI